MLKSQQDRLVDRFWRLALVNILSNLMVPLASLIDTAFLGHLADIRHLGGVAIASIVFNYIYWSFGFLRMATTGTTAQAAGASDRDTVILTLLRNGAIAIFIALVILILQYPLREVGFTLLSAAPEVLESGRDYYNVLIWGAPATLLNFVLLGWFLGRELAGKVLILSIIDKGANVALNYLFIVQLGWASSGAAAATAISQYLNLLVGLTFIWREFPYSSLLQYRNLIFNSKTLKAAFTLNSNIFIRTLALISTFAVFTNLSSALGTTVLAVNTLLLQVVTFGAYFIDGIAFATESIAGNLYAQKNNRQLLSLIKLAGGASLIAGLLFALVFWSLPSLFELLTNHAEIIKSLMKYTIWLFPVLGFGSIAYMLDGYFLGLTQGKILRTSTVIAAVVGFALVAIAAWQLQNIHLLWLALCMFMIGRVITLGWKVPQTLKKRL
ncbi:guanitoxin biosynthesis MATE family efflux transporter GntT [Myxosarcina sp. GI1]|uniref:guanitoxin biosynthesis MATE family efflux transporter GntT n=1 Tax=Myxosarcina sp. GI1 TaxID=1541065 RepID=UPI000561F248|nr:guanitoxin biosynthesis MATE family efflux transporter GntT [Myxosarcina sp. GI1]